MENCFLTSLIFFFFLKAESALLWSEENVEYSELRKLSGTDLTCVYTEGSFMTSFIHRAASRLRLITDILNSLTLLTY